MTETVKYTHFELAIQKRVASSTWNIGKTSRALELGHWETSRALELGVSETTDRTLEWYFAEIMTGNILILHKTLHAWFYHFIRWQPFANTLFTGNHFKQDSSSTKELCLGDGQSTVSVARSSQKSYFSPPAWNHWYSPLPPVSRALYGVPRYHCVSKALFHTI